jgi:GT2 family glycosyltransferase
MTSPELPFVRLVVLNWNSGDLLARCLDSLASLDWPPDRLEVVVIDNASTDGSVVDLERRRPGVRLMGNDRNTGFGANNLAIADLDGIDLVGLVNPDVVVDVGWLTALAAAMGDDVGLGAACPKILLGDGSGPRIIQNAGSELSSDGNSRDRGYGEPDGERYDTPVDVDAWCGAAVLLRADYLRHVGVFEERLFLYYEDTDLSWRGGNRGWRYRYVPDAECWHLHGASTGLTGDLARYYQTRNRLLVATRNAPAQDVLRAWLRAVGGIVLAIRPRGSGLSSVGRLRAVVGALRQLPWAFTTRRSLRAPNPRDARGG